MKYWVNVVRTLHSGFYIEAECEADAEEKAHEILNDCDALSEQVANGEWDWCDDTVSDVIKCRED